MFDDFAGDCLRLSHLFRPFTPPHCTIHFCFSSLAYTNTLLALFLDVSFAHFGHWAMEDGGATAAIGISKLLKRCQANSDQTGFLPLKPLRIGIELVCPQQRGVHWLGYGLCEVFTVDICESTTTLDSFSFTSDSICSFQIWYLR